MDDENPDNEQSKSWRDTPARVWVGIGLIVLGGIIPKVMEHNDKAERREALKQVGIRSEARIRIGDEFMESLGRGLASGEVVTDERMALRRELDKAKEEEAAAARKYGISDEELKKIQLQARRRALKE